MKMFFKSFYAKFQVLGSFKVSMGFPKNLSLTRKEPIHSKSDKNTKEPSQKCEKELKISKETLKPVQNLTHSEKTNQNFLKIGEEIPDNSTNKIAKPIIPLTTNYKPSGNSNLKSTNNFAQKFSWNASNKKPPLSIKDNLHLEGSNKKRFGNSFSSNDNKRPVDLVADAVEQIIIKNNGDWAEVRNFVLENNLSKGKYAKYNPHNIDSFIMTYCISKERYDLAYNYFKYLSKEKIKPNLATLAKYLRVLYHRNLEKCSSEDEQEILTLYEQVLKEYPVLETNSLNGLILALSVTKEWKKCLDLLQEFKTLYQLPVATDSAVVSAMFCNKEESSAWKLLYEITEAGKIPNSIAFLAYLKSLKRLRKVENIAEKLENLFNFFKDTEIICQEDVAKEILKICLKNFSTTTKVKIPLEGNCKNCGKNLEKSELSQTEFEQLRQKFMKNVILGKDLFLKTDPSELSKFKEFLETMENFDVVLDGLNIAYSTGDKNPHVISKMLCEVIKHYKQRHKSVLVLGRVHMKHWPKESWNYIVENCSVFLTKNISQDDPYLLYCALNSGQNTIIVTRDLMRGHKFLLKDVKLKKLFQKWLDQRQHILLTIGKNEKPIFRKPAEFSPIAQKSNEIWHIPVESSVEGLNEHYHKTWLCLKLK